MKKLIFLLEIGLMNFRKILGMVFLKKFFKENFVIPWNDPKEIPSENNKEILIYNKYKKVYIEKLPSCLRSCKLTKDRWKEFVEEKEILYWIYLKNLLPK